MLRAAKLIGLKARVVVRRTAKQLAATPAPAIVTLCSGGFSIFGGRVASGHYRLVDPVTSTDRLLSIEVVVAEIEPRVVLVGRRVGGRRRSEELRLSLVPALERAALPGD